MPNNYIASVTLYNTTPCATFTQRSETCGQSFLNNNNTFNKNIINNKNDSQLSSI